MKNFFLLTVTISIIIGCDPKQRINCVRPYTEKEQNFIKSFEKNDIRVELNRFNYYPFSKDSLMLVGSMTDTYSHYFYDESVENVLNLDSMRTKTRAIAQVLYTQIMSDFIIMYNSKIVIDIKSKRAKKHRNFGILYSATFEKKDLESYCGFYIKDNGTHFSRGKSTSKSDTLTITKEGVY